ncbi:MAG: GIY-YIG nuclease family protein [Atribacterota bacterium]|nr:GIY-YIG nuclease family protein [Atribacterota bacterium]MDD4896480.1 GIY-YIG nuclease family protein [Atribacterota bacterium]MDD5636542.1 GIY-YIG nuclease family protein [Atribacterota bacterium]
MIGKLGWVNVNRGYYIYIGSAKKSIQQRLLRHLTRKKNRFWHIDYLLSSRLPIRVINIWISQKPCECSISQEIFQIGIGIVVKEGFGSSDCRCLSHLFRVNVSNLDLLRQVMTKKNFYSLLEDHN